MHRKILCFIFELICQMNTTTLLLVAGVAAVGYFYLYPAYKTEKAQQQVQETLQQASNDKKKLKENNKIKTLLNLTTVRHKLIDYNKRR